MGPDAYGANSNRLTHASQKHRLLGGDLDPADEDRDGAARHLRSGVGEEYGAPGNRKSEKAERADEHKDVHDPIGDAECEHDKPTRHRGSELRDARCLPRKPSHETQSTVRPMSLERPSERRKFMYPGDDAYGAGDES